MNKVFNISGDCKPDMHFMVDIGDRLAEMKAMIDRGDYFTVNRARQFGKTTTLKALRRYLKNEYQVLSLDFQKLSHKDFETERAFVEALAREILKKLYLMKEVPDGIVNGFRQFTQENNFSLKLAILFECFSKWCQKSEKPVVLIVDEVDSATNNQVFLDFLAQIRGYYIDRDEAATFQSVILADVYDVKNLKRKFVTDGEHRVNSPWNIAADFNVDMSFSSRDIAGMLEEYEASYKTGMDIEVMSDMIYDYTSGYPYLVSRICKLIDERIAGDRDYNKSDAWTEEGLQEALKILLTERNTLFESLIAKLAEYPELRKLLYMLLFEGSVISYNPLNKSIEVAEMLGFVVNRYGNAVVSNRIFETILYNWFLSEESVGNEIHKAALQDKNQFIREGDLDMELELIRLEEVHIDELTKIMERAFNEDARIHLGKERGGPDGYDDGSFLRKWGLHKDASSYCISLNQQLIGGVILWINEDKNNFLGNIFIDPACENHGMGTKVWNMIEQLYPDTKIWNTETPAFSSRNHNFYVNKCGFHIIKIENPKDKLEGKYILQKVIREI
ncbi:MAG: GNAT family N-acetyltransferase [Dorea sp.]|nr:GNAT family N-acetyltransferase [Dorea sp.]